MPPSTLLALFFLLGRASDARSAWQADLPADAVIVESKTIAGHPDRLLVLWVLSPKRYSNAVAEGERYDTCWLETQGSQYYRARTRVSLIDTRKNSVINTVELETPGGDDPTLAIPLQIRRGRYWVQHPTGEGKPQIMQLRDYNGDGLPLEFAIYETETCSAVFGTLLGYSERQDKVIWYSVDLTTDDEGTLKTTTSHWVDGLFGPNQKARRGRWRFTRQYPEEPPRIYRYEISYDKRGERFYGTETITRSTR